MTAPKWRVASRLKDDAIADDDISAGCVVVLEWYADELHARALTDQDRFADGMATHAARVGACVVVFHPCVVIPSWGPSN